MNAWLPQSSYPCGDIFDTYCLKPKRSEGSWGTTFTGYIYINSLKIKVKQAFTFLLHRRFLSFMNSPQSTCTTVLLSNSSPGTLSIMIAPNQKVLGIVTRKSLLGLDPPHQLSKKPMPCSISQVAYQIGDPLCATPGKSLPEPPTYFIPLLTLHVPDQNQVQQGLLPLLIPPSPFP